MRIHIKDLLRKVGSDGPEFHGSRVIASRGDVFADANINIFSRPRGIGHDIGDRLTHDNYLSRVRRERAGEVDATSKTAVVIPEERTSRTGRRRGGGRKGEEKRERRTVSRRARVKDSPVSNLVPHSLSLSLATGYKVPPATSTTEILD